MQDNHNLVLSISESELTQKRLKELLRYDSDTGIFRWKMSPHRRCRAGAISGTLNSRGYICIMIDGRKYRAHRLAWLYIHGNMPPNEIDHINHIQDDNRLCNLRLATRTENSRNVSLYKNNSSGFVGVYWDKSRNKWQARVQVNGKSQHLGYFDKIEDAVRARKAASKKYGFHKNHGKNEMPKEFAIA
jgi:hypothetical protein